jgi:hypothetical protein
MRPRTYARVPVCGLISQYSATRMDQGRVEEVTLIAPWSGSSSRQQASKKCRPGHCHFCASGADLLGIGAS